MEILFKTKMAKSDTLFMTKTAEKPYPLGPYIPTEPSPCKVVAPGESRSVSLTVALPVATSDVALY